MAENFYTDTSGKTATPFPLGETLTVTWEEGGAIYERGGRVVAYSEGLLQIESGGRTITFNTRSSHFIKAETKK